MKYRNKSLRERLLRCIQQYLIGVVVVLLCPTTIASAQTAEQIAEKALAATVYLEMKDRNGATLGFGSGFFVKENLIATNFHIIEGAAQGTAKLVGKYTTYTIEGITATDETNDLVLLKVTVYGIKPLPLGDSDNVRIGATVYVAGNPLGLEGTFSNGIISSRRDRYTKERLQMTAPISPGSSGGPVLNRKGEIIGISFMTIEGGQNLNFAIPSNYLFNLLSQSGSVTPLAQGSISASTYFIWGNTKYMMGRYKDIESIIANYDNSLAALPTQDSDRLLRRALEDYNKAIQLKPDYAEAYANRGLTKVALRQNLAAIRDCDFAIQLKPDYAPLYYVRGATKVELEQHLSAIADFDTAIILKPDYANAYHGRGITKETLGQHLSAIVDYDIAIRFMPDDGDFYASRAAAKVAIGQHSAAIADYDTAIRLAASYVPLYFLYYNRGIAKSNLGRHAAAIADFDMAVSIKPDYAEVYHSRGFAKANLEQYFAAVADYDMVIQFKPDNAIIHALRGFAKYNLGLTWEAKQDFQTALKLAKQISDADLKSQMEEALRFLE